MKKPPCRGCDYERMSKRCQVCTDCTARVAYADSVDLAGLIIHSSRMVVPATVVKAVTNEPEVKETHMKDEKTCSNCGEEYPRTEDYFYKNPACSDGFEGQCKTCRAIKKGVKNPGKRGPKPRLKKTVQETAPEQVLVHEPVIADAGALINYTFDGNDPVAVLFADHPELRERLKKIADGQFRTEKQQLLWMVDFAIQFSWISDFTASFWRKG